MIIIFSIIALNVFFYILPYIIDFSKGQGNSVAEFLMLFWKDNQEIKDGEWYRLLTSTFLHADFLHLVVNMYSIWSISPLVMSIFSAGGYLTVYFVSGLFGSLASFYLNPNPSIGASGAVFGLIGALLGYALKNNEPSLLGNLITVIVVNLAIGFLPGSRIDNFGHLGGLVGGFLISLIWLSLV